MKRRTLSIAVPVAICIAVIIFGRGRLFADQGNGAAAGQGEVAPEAPHSPAAIESKRKYDLSVKLAREAYHKALLTADQQYVSDLTAVLKTTMDAGPSAIDEAKRIDAARTAAVNVLEEQKQEGTSRVVNLIPLIDVKKDAVSGTWRLDHGAIVSDDAGAARLRIPYEPPEEYDYHIEFSRISGNNDVNQMFRYFGHSCALEMGAWGNSICGFTRIDGMQSNDKNNPSRFEGHDLLQNGRVYSALIQVRKGSVTASIDGKVISKCSLDPSKFSAEDTWSVGADGLGLGSAQGPTVFSVIEVVEISGPGKQSPR